jgi:ADP-dependent NAD(P)H-hydrate dehydratase / NAD(P)H-hydrate epimerase
MYIMSRESCQKVDNYAIKEIGIPSIVLMENAANEVVLRIKNIGEKYVIFCGEGNNGGDGLAIGRKLINLDKEVIFIIINERNKFTSDFEINLSILKNMGADIFYINREEDISTINEVAKEEKIVIDCIFGVGLNRDISKLCNKIIDFININFNMIISVDVPSGLNVDTGEIMGNSIRAKRTYSFEVMKKGFISYKALEYLGDLEIINIGIPKEAKEINSEKTFILNREDYKKLIKLRKIYGHKSNYGKISILAGSRGFTGAAKITTNACVKAGAGLTTLITEEYVQDILSCTIIEGMTINLQESYKVIKNLEEANVIAIGPGIQEVESYMDLIRNIKNMDNKFFVIDAGALEGFSKDKEVMNKVRNKAVFTPHPGEMARIINKPIRYVEENRMKVAKEYAKANNIVVLLKGYNTVITDGDNTYINPKGNSKMSSGGMGDSLTGIIASLIGQGNSLIEGALLGAYIHGLSGEKAGENKYSVIASDIIENIPLVMENIIIEN